MKIMSTSFISFTKSVSNPPPQGWDDPNIWAPATVTYAGTTYQGKAALVDTETNPPSNQPWDGYAIADMRSPTLVPNFIFTQSHGTGVPPNISCVLTVAKGNGHFEYAGVTACQWVQPPGSPYGAWNIVGENCENTTQPTWY